ncbi:MAG: hypothetical protein HYY09_05845 [Firmicutes bacterium]|nr:hypothetical protein [Bacillota bacterium]
MSLRLLEKEFLEVLHQSIRRLAVPDELLARVLYITAKVIFSDLVVWAPDRGSSLPSHRSYPPVLIPELAAMFEKLRGLPSPPCSPETVFDLKGDPAGNCICARMGREPSGSGGWLYACRSPDKKPFSEEEEQLLQGIAMVGERHLRSLSRENATLHHIGLDPNFLQTTGLLEYGLYLGQNIQFVLEVACRHLNLQTAVVYKLNHLTGQLVPLAFWHNNSPVSLGHLKSQSPPPRGCPVLLGERGIQAGGLIKKGICSRTETCSLKGDRTSVEILCAPILDGSDPIGLLQFSSGDGLRPPLEGSIPFTELVSSIITAIRYSIDTYLQTMQLDLGTKLAAALAESTDASPASTSRLLRAILKFTESDLAVYRLDERLVTETIIPDSDKTSTAAFESWAASWESGLDPGNLDVPCLKPTGIAVFPKAMVIPMTTVLPKNSYLFLSRRIGTEFSSWDLKIISANLPQLSFLFEKYILAQTRKQRWDELERFNRVATIDQLAAGVAHEIRNPLATIRGYVELIKRGGLDPAAGLMNKIMAELDRVDIITKEMLSYVRPKESVAEIHSLNHILSESLSLIEHKAFVQGIAIGLNTDPSIDTVRMDRNRLRQVFLNLALNAVESLGFHGHLTVNTMPVDSSQNNGAGRIRIAFIDDGPGIPPEIRDRIFEPFVSGKSNGTGLGLNISRKIITELGGTLTFKSQPGHTEFAVELPIPEQS